MEKLNSFAALPGADFYGAFEAADPNNSSIDSEIASYLNNNPDGMEFSYGGKDYVLAKDQTTNKYTLHLQTPSGSVLKDEDVQMNTKYAPDGFVEIGGLSKVGTRLFIGRAPDNVEQVIAFEGAHDISSVSFRPENAVVLYDGSKKPVDDAPAPADTEAPSTPGGGEEQSDFADFYNGWMGGGGDEALPPESEPATGGIGTTVPTNTSPATGDTETPTAGAGAPTADTGAPTADTETPDEVADEPTATDIIDESAEIEPNTNVPTEYYAPHQLDEGTYEVGNDGGWYNSAGEKVGLSFCISGKYEVKNGEFFRVLNSGELIPASPINGYYLMGSSFTSQTGGKQEVSFELLREGGAPVDQIAFDSIGPDDVDDEATLIVIDGVELVADSDGTVLGKPSYLWSETT